MPIRAAADRDFSTARKSVVVLPIRISAENNIVVLDQQSAEAAEMAQVSICSLLNGSAGRSCSYTCGKGRAPCHSGDSGPQETSQNHRQEGMGRHRVHSGGYGAAHADQKAATVCHGCSRRCHPKAFPEISRYTTS